MQVAMQVYFEFPTARRTAIGPLTTPANVVAKNHLFSAFVSATKSQTFVQKDNDLFLAKICRETLKTHGNGL